MLDAKSEIRQHRPLCKGAASSGGQYHGRGPRGVKELKAVIHLLDYSDLPFVQFGPVIDAVKASNLGLGLVNGCLPEVSQNVPP